MLQVVGSNPVGALPGCKRCCGWKRHEHWFCSRCRIFRAHLSWIRNLCLFHFIWISVQFWTSEPICFFYVCSVSAVLPFPLFPGLAPESLLAAILDLIPVRFFFLGKWGSVATLWRENRKMMKIGTLVEMVINRDLTNFGVYKTNSIAPPPVQKFIIEEVITCKLLMVEKWNLVHLIRLFMLITVNNWY